MSSLKNLIYSKVDSKLKANHKAGSKGYFLKSRMSFPSKVKSFGQLFSSVYGVGRKGSEMASRFLGFSYGTSVLLFKKQKLQGILTSGEQYIQAHFTPLQTALHKLNKSALEFKVRNGFVSGKRYLSGLPTRGQRSKTNAKTSKARRKLVSALQ